MLLARSNITHFQSAVAEKVHDYAQLIKLRLSLLVVFSAVVGFLIGNAGFFARPQLIWLILGGFLVTGASNAINQIMEKDVDRIMKRTASRPLPSGRMSVEEAVIASVIMGCLGLVILGVYLDPICALLGLIALIIYAFVYTPLKRKSNVAVFVGAIPGAIPVMIGWAAATHSLGITVVLLFSIQFIWQFPHTWAIAWLLHDDYKEAGIKMLPSKSGRSKNTAIQIVLYTLLLIPISLLPAKFGVVGFYSSIVIFLAGSVFLYQAINLLLKCNKKAALQVMLGSIIYLPIVQLALVFDRLF